MSALPQHTKTQNRMSALVRQFRQDLNTLARDRGQLPLTEAQERINTLLFQLMDMAHGNENATERLAEISKHIRQSLSPATDDALHLAAAAQVSMNDLLENIDEINAALADIEKRHLMLESAIKKRDASHEVVGELIDEGRELERLWVIEAGYSLTADPAADVSALMEPALDGLVEEYTLHDFVQLLAYKLEQLPRQRLEELADFIHNFTEED